MGRRWKVIVARWGALWVAALLVASTVGGCRFDRRRPMHPERPPGDWYVVSEGETLADIAARAGVPVEDLLELNGLERAEQVTPGKLLYVLDGKALEAGLQASADAKASAGGPMTAGVGAVPGRPERLRWPLDNPQVGSYFGTRLGRKHEGIDLPAATGTPVHAAAPGRVVYAGNGIRGYGNLIVLQHVGDLLTVYAHNATLLVRQGEEVAAGQRVALVGQSGRATGPHLHFEVRQGQIPRDPLPFLPSLSSEPGAAAGSGGAP